MNIVIIGSGNVATVLGRLFKQKNHQVLQIVSRYLENAKILADELNCDYINFEGVINKTADLYIVAVYDRLLLEINKGFSLNDKIIVHTAGSVSKDVLQHISTNFGILYPLQSLNKSNNNIPEIPFLIEANNEQTTTTLLNFANSVSSNVKICTEIERKKIHLASVVVNNFTNHLYTLTYQFCKDENLDFSLLQPIIYETTNRLLQKKPAELQTGPAKRGDTSTLEKHLSLLKNHPKLKYLYIKFTDSIISHCNEN